jgi:hypothetical protein
MADRVARARLRPGKDDDIRAALDEAIKTNDESDVIRAALRSYFNSGQEGVHVKVQRSVCAKSEHKPAPVFAKTETPVIDGAKALDMLLGL